MANLYLKVLVYGVWFSSARLVTGAFTFTYFLQLGLSITDISLARFIQLLALVILDVPAGYLADRFGKVKVLVFSALMSTLWLIFVPNVDSLGSLIFSELLNAVSLAGFGGAFEMLLRENSRTRRHPFAQLTKYQFFMIAVSSLIGSVVAEAFSADAAWTVAAVAQGLLTAWSLIFLRSAQPIEDEKVAPRSADPPGRILGLKITSTVIIFIGTTICYEAVLMFWQPILASSGFGLGDFTGLGVIFIVFVFLQALAGVLFAPMTKIMRLLVPLLVILGMTQWLLNGTDFSVISMLLFLAVFFLVSKVVSIKALAFLAEEVAGPKETKLFSTVSTLSRVATACAMLIIGSVLEVTLLVGPVVLAMSLILAALIIYMRAKESKETNGE